MNYFSSIIIGIFSSLIASFIFILCLFRIKPNIVISDSVAFCKSKIDQKDTYYFKVINMENRLVINIQAKLFVITTVNGPGGVNKYYKQVMLVTDKLYELEPNCSRDETAQYHYMFATKEDLTALWQNDSNQHLRFQIIATDPITGFSKVFKKDYTKRNSIKKGIFQTGASLEIKEFS